MPIDIRQNDTDKGQLGQMTLSQMIQRQMTLGQMTLSKTTLCKMPLSQMTLSTIESSIMASFEMFWKDLQILNCYVGRPCTEWHYAK